MPRNSLRVVYLLISAAAAAWVFFVGQRVMRADVYSLPARKALLMMNESSAGDLIGISRNVEADLLKAIRTDPDNPEIRVDLGDLYVFMSRHHWVEQAKSMFYADAAIEQYILATELQPYNAYNWARLVTVYQSTGSHTETLAHAWAKAVELGQNEDPVCDLLLNSALANWSFGPAEIQQWVLDYYARSNENKRAAINEKAKPYGLVFKIG